MEMEDVLEDKITFFYNNLFTSGLVILSNLVNNSSFTEIFSVTAFKINLI
jgi:hypothetical protein